MPGAVSNTHHSRPILAGPAIYSPKCSKHSQCSELGFSELAQTLASCEACLDLASVKTVSASYADSVDASHDSLNDANLLYVGDGLFGLASSPWLVYAAHDERLYRRGHAPASLQLYSGSVHAAFINSHTAHVATAYSSLNILTSPGPLSAGPAGYRYTALAVRTPEFESLRYNHGIRFKKHVPFRAILHWRLLCDEGAAPTRFKEWIVAFFKPMNMNKIFANRGKMGAFQKTKN